MEKNLPDLAEIFSNAILIAIETVIRIIRILLEKKLADFGQILKNPACSSHPPDLMTCRITE
jgi:hypothetical protein